MRTVQCTPYTTEALCPCVWSFALTCLTGQIIRSYSKLDSDTKSGAACSNITFPVSSKNTDLHPVDHTSHARYYIYCRYCNVVIIYVAAEVEDRVISQ